MSPKKILFILHEDSQSGAPNALLSFLNYLKMNYNNIFSFDIFVLNSHGKFGLEKELKNVSNQFYKKNKKKAFFSKLLNVFSSNIKLILIKNKYDLIYGNTIVTLKTLDKIKRKNKNIKILLHVHESQYLCSLLLNRKIAIDQFDSIDRILTVAKFSADNLIKNYHVEPEKITIIHPTVEKERPPENNPLTTVYKEFDLVLTNIGHPNLTKGTELIPQIASLLRNRNPKLKFKILVDGILNDNEYIKAIKLDIYKLNLDNYIELIPHTNQPLNYLAVANAYLITSREDSFSLMGLQAALFEKPIINFKNAIGLSDILDKTCTFQADYLNINDFVEQIELVYNNPELVNQKTALAKQKCDELLDLEKSNQKHYEELKKFINS